jgi:hypothetical protein
MPMIGRVVKYYGACRRYRIYDGKIWQKAREVRMAEEVMEEG